MKYIIITIFAIAGFTTGYYFSPIDRVQTEFKFVEEPNSAKVIYNECVSQISILINPLSGSIRDYPQEDFSILVNECMKLSTPPSN